MAGNIERNISNLHDADTGVMTGYKNPVTGKEVALDTAALQSLVLGDWTLILDAANAGTAGLWQPIRLWPERLIHQLDSGSTPSAYTIDFSADGIGVLGQHSTWTWASSTASEATFRLEFVNPDAKFFRAIAMTGGPINIWRRGA